ncbi:MAG: ATP-dependent DNA helicase RecG [Oscillospiraceae bacterium]|jgi:ATP-dependent DNA helicase RecG|nr:ATP-dependent DNA helicase RecG [Oscillospiraceae bacterium]
MTELQSEVRYLKGIGQQRAGALAKLGIRTLYDLITYFPRGYEDRSETLPIAALTSGMSACVRAIVVTEPSLSRVRRGLELVKLRVADDSGSIDVTYFNQSYVRTQLKKGCSYIFFGRLAAEGARRTMANPVFEPEDGPAALTGRIVPIYRLTTGLSQKLMSASVRQGLDAAGNALPDPLPASAAENAQLCKAPFAYENIHFPADFGALELARRRLVFEELFVLSCALTRMKSTRIKKSGIYISTPRLERFYSKLPFLLTGAQKRAAEDCTRDMRSGATMNRLIQGDVGSGKTVVAAACVWCAHEGGLQTAFMAPTEILAAQHFRTFSELLAPFGIAVALLTGAMPAKQKREALARIASGEVSLVVGTHALLSESVAFSRLALVITDEQHRFGVNQRAALIAKGESPHTLVMSATPIPRTLALIIYGDLDVSVINELPPGRQKVDTFAVGEGMRERIYGFIRKQVLAGRQVFIVCPAVDENEERPQELKNAVDYAAELQEKIFPELRVGCVHGRMKAAEKDKRMRAFADGQCDILVATTVIEVGVDVPNAALMVVENAERFGLGQLHQLRGRVGRGKYKSYCVLFSDSENAVSRARLKVMEQTNDGFKISEEDLRLRGPGDFFGSRQHGLPEMGLADLGMDMRVLSEAQDAANALLRSDPELRAPENAKLRERIDTLFSCNEGTFN